MSNHEAIVYGVNAALAVAAHRPDQILRVFYSARLRKVLRPLLKATAAERRPYRELPLAELDRVAKGIHHEGVVVITQPLRLRSLDWLLEKSPGEECVLALDHVGNPHNLGAILRSGAWFGARALLIPREPGQAQLSAAAIRVAQGGAELLPCVGVDELFYALKELKGAGFTLLAADQRGQPLDGRSMERPLCLIMGSEGQGLNPKIRALAHAEIAIPGTGALESLNVSVAAGILLAEAFRF